MPASLSTTANCVVSVSDVHMRLLFLQARCCLPCDHLHQMKTKPVPKTDTQYGAMNHRSRHTGTDTQVCRLHRERATLFALSFKCPYHRYNVLTARIGASRRQNATKCKDNGDATKRLYVMSRQQQHQPTP